MNDKLEKIDLIKKRANVSYQAAKEALEKNDYDVVETLIDLERQNKLKDEAEYNEKFTKSTSEKNEDEKKSTPSEDGISQSIKRLFRKSMDSSFILKNKHGEQVLKLPLLIAIMLILFTVPFSVLLLILAIVFKYKIIIRYDGKTTCFNEVIDDLNEKYEQQKEEKSNNTSSKENSQDSEIKINLDK